MKIGIGSDHVAYELKLAVIDHLRAEGHEVIDFGAPGTERTDYPKWGARVAYAVAGGEVERGIVMCGTGIGISLAANKVRGIRCACVSEPYSAAMARSHNDANMVGLGARVVGLGVALGIIDTFLTTDFEGGRHEARVAQISELEG